MAAECSKMLWTYIKNVGEETDEKYIREMQQVYWLEVEHQLHGKRCGTVCEGKSWKESKRSGKGKLYFQ